MLKITRLTLFELVNLNQLVTDTSDVNYELRGTGADNQLNLFT